MPSVEEIRAGGYDAVIAAGGDGTVRELARSLGGGGTPIGFVPMGTGNVLAHEIGLPRTADGIARVLLEGPAIDLHGARANGEPFFLMAGAGFDGDVVRRLDTVWKRRLGKAAYALPVLGTLARPLPRLEVEIGGRVHEASWAVITRARHYGGSFMLAERADLRRPGLVAVLVSAASRALLVRKLMGLPAGTLLAQPGVEAIGCDRAVVRAVPPVHTQIDGDAFGTTPLEIESGGAPLCLIVPPGYAAGR